jgi:hypothetical protein
MCRQCLMWPLDRRATNILFGGYHSSYVALVSHGYMFPKYCVPRTVLLSVPCALRGRRVKVSLLRLKLVLPEEWTFSCHTLLHRAGLYCNSSIVVQHERYVSVKVDEN